MLQRAEARHLKMPGYWLKNPSPKAEAKLASAGKQEVQESIATKAPKGADLFAFATKEFASPFSKHAFLGIFFLFINPIYA